MPWWWPFGVDVKKRDLNILIYSKQELNWIKNELKKTENLSEGVFTQALEKAVGVRRELKVIDRALGREVETLIGLLEVVLGYSKSDKKMGRVLSILPHIVAQIDKLQEEIKRRLGQ